MMATPLSFRACRRRTAGSPSAPEITAARLVEDQQLHLMHEGAGDLDHLAGRDRQFLDEGIGIDVDGQPLKISRASRRVRRRSMMPSALRRSWPR